MQTAAIIFILILIFVCKTLAYKWYERNPEANHEQQRYVELWNSGCCEDTIKCKAEVPQYLGMEVFMRIWEDAIIGKKTHPYMYMIHQGNYMVSTTFGLEFLPSQKSIGRIGKNEDNYWSKQLNAICTKSKHGQPSEYTTGFSVYHYFRSYLVCDDTVIDIQMKEGRQKETKITIINRRNACICLPKGHSKTDCINGVHPVFCDSDEKLMSIAAVPTKVNDANPYLYGFYSKHDKHETLRTQRRYTVKVWRYQNYEKDPIHSTASTGYLTEVDTFKEDATGYYGMYFTNDGNACPFNGTYSNDAKIKDQSDLTFEYLKTPRQPCLSFQVFIGCPQPWCFSNRFDASFTVKSAGETFIFFAVGRYLWKVKDQGFLPLAVPKVEDARTPVLKKGKSYEGNTMPCIDYLQDRDFVFCSVPNIGAAVTAFVWNAVYIIMYSTSKKLLFFSKQGDLNEPARFETSNILNYRHEYRYDAFWYNEKEGLVYGFTDNTFESYETERNIKPNSSGNLIQFGVESSHLDACVNRKATGYFFYNNFYYKVPEENWKSQASRPKIFAMTDFFDVRKECYANDKQAYETLVSRFKQKEYKVDETSTVTVELITRATQETKAPRSRMYLFYIIVPGILIALGVIVCIFTFGTMASRKKRIKSISKLKKSKALKGESPSPNLSTKPTSLVGLKARKDITRRSKI